MQKRQPYQPSFGRDEFFCRFKANLHGIRLSSVFLRFCFLLKKYALFYPQFYKSIPALTRQSHTGQKFSEKNFFVKGYSSILKYRSYRSYTKFLNKIFIHI